MPVVFVHLLTAVICWSGQCYPILVGRNTPPGNYYLHHLYTSLPGYGGDVLAFARDNSGVFAIHRVWTLHAGARRIWILTHSSISDRRNSTAGCVNVMPEVYEKLVDCCSQARLIIEP